MFFPKKSLLSLSFGLLTSITAQAALIDFNEHKAGTIMSDQYIRGYGLSISAVNIGGGPDIATLFDTTQKNNRDRDLVGPNIRKWSGGNIAADEAAGNILIIAENDRDRDGDGILDKPDDEGSRPAGTITFDFLNAIDKFGFDLIDIEGPDSNGNDDGYLLDFYANNSKIKTVGFSEFTTPKSEFFDSTIEFGDHTANKISTISASEIGAINFDRIDIVMGGSGGINNLYWEDYEPATHVEVSITDTLLLNLAGILLVLAVSRRLKNDRANMMHVTSA